MYTRRITRFRPKRSVERNPSLWRRLQMRGGAILLTLGALAIGGLLFMAPNAWAVEQVNTINAALNPASFADMGRIEEAWVALPQVPAFARGDEPAVVELLKGAPLLEALWDRRRRQLWLRDQDHLIPVPEADLLPLQVFGWVKQAEEAGRFQWTPPLPENLDPVAGPAIILRGDEWTVVKRWRIGSPDTERFLRQVFTRDAKFRFGLIRLQDKESPQLVRQPWGAEPNLQLDPARISEFTFGNAATSNAFDGWELVALPFRQQAQAHWKQVERHYYIAVGASLCVGLSLALGVWLRYRARQRAILDADRLATLTHSLKTPLAILKFRCDSIRLGRLPEDQVDAQLIKVGEEVDHLTLIIENGLDAIRGTSETGPQGEVTAAWLSHVAEDLAPAFEAESRPLDLQLTSDSGRAALPSLRSALLTLLENALFHGQGLVTLRAHKVRKRLQIQVTDEGPGLDRAQMEALGKPFMRIRTRGHEGFQREGQGLGLSLLIQVAQKEGWGLSFGSAPGEGFTATIDIRAI